MARYCIGLKYVIAALLSLLLFSPAIVSATTLAGVRFHPAGPGAVIRAFSQLLLQLDAARSAK